MSTPTTEQPQVNAATQGHPPIMLTFTFTILDPSSFFAPGATPTSATPTTTPSNPEASTNDQTTTSPTSTATSGESNSVPQQQQQNGPSRTNFQLPLPLLLAMQQMLMDALRNSSSSTNNNGTSTTTGQGEEQGRSGYVNLAEFLNHTFQLHQQQRAGPPPASANAVKNLKELEVVDETHSPHGKDCAVCQDTFVKGDKALQLPCDHFFHGDCVRPWLKDHNTCPTCRYELPTDDSEYEKGRKERMARREEAKRQRERGGREQWQCELGRIRREDCCLFGEPELVTLECGHQLHRECAAEWDRAQRNGRCPACNKAVTFPSVAPTTTTTMTTMTTMMPTGLGDVDVGVDVVGVVDESAATTDEEREKKRQRTETEDADVDEGSTLDVSSPMVLADPSADSSGQ